MKKILSAAMSLLLIFAMIISPTLAGTAISTDDIVDAALVIIRQNEGSYSSVNKDDNGALSVGFLQWHGSRALSLIRDVVYANLDQALEILGVTLYKEIIETTDTWSTRILTDNEAKLISALLATDESKAAQDKLASSNVLSYITRGQNLGITSPAALVYFADLENQCGGGGSSRVGKAAIELAGNAADVTLEHIHKAALADSVAGKYASRRNKVYNYAMLLGWETNENTEPYEIWLVNYTLNVRSGPGTTYEKVTSYTSGTYVAVYEKQEVNGSEWGRTPAGWISLYYCKFMTNPFEDEIIENRNLTFDPNGGTLESTPEATLEVDVVNGTRMENQIALYTSSYGATSGTNKWGCELQVDANGLVLCDALLHACNMKIPEDGFVISAHGTAIEVLQETVKAGNFVHFDLDALTLEIYSSKDAYNTARKTVKVGEPYGELPTPTAPYAGMTFAGWESEDGTIITFDMIVEASHSERLTARWKGEEYEVVYDLAGGEFRSVSYTVNAINSVRLTDYLVVYNGADGRTTSGTNEWGTEVMVFADGTVQNDAVFMTHDLTIPQGGYVLSGHGTARLWMCDNIRAGNFIDFNADDMTITVWMSADDFYGREKNIEIGAPVGALPTPTRTGYTFGGWTGDDGELVTSETVITKREALTLTAAWTPVTVSVTLDANGGTVSSSQITATFESVIGELPIPELDWHTFIGWTDADGKTYTEDTVITTTADFTLTAVWVPITTTVTFDANGGTVSAEQMTVNCGTSIGTLPTPERAGYTFNGWVDADGNTVTGETVITTTETLALTAKWTPVTVTLTLDANGGTVSTSQIYATYDNVLGELPTPTLDEYIFVGWFSGDTLIDADMVSIFTEDTTLTARWKPVRQTGDVDGNGIINITDLFCLKSILVGDLDPYSYYPDADGNDIVTVSDLFAVKSLLLGK